MSGASAGHVSIVGPLDIRTATDSRGRKRLVLGVVGRQLLFLRRRSPAKAAAFYEQPASGGFARPRVG
jgi:hypothetical protein